MLAGLVGFGVTAILGGTARMRDAEAMRTFAEHRFVDVWDDAPKRHALAVELSRALDVDVAVRDADGRVLDGVGDSCERPQIRLEPQREDASLGRVDMCWRPSVTRRLTVAASLLAALSILWLVSHKIARRIGRPILELSRAATEIGRGHYDVDIRIGRRPPVEILRLGESVRDMAAKIKKQMADQRELLASVSHEIRSPLARVRLLLELLRTGDGPSVEREKLLGDLEAEIEEMDHLVGGLLASSRLDFTALSMRPHDVVAATERAVSRAGLTLEPTVEGSPREVQCDATLLSRALANLLENADKHGDGATGVHVRFESDRVTFEVADRGPGVPEEDLRKIFDPFYRRPTRGHESRAHESLGLGLALVQRIAEGHGGEAFAHPNTPSGAVVGFSIPTDAGPESSTDV
ncbi:MAG TPA: HAMP domain-containing sensor histidine kinase [Polyangiaceae bacterium]|nr:HAMP domain-containing sensor histidine kinase [Polyangiaceae bacterium]